MSRKRQHPKSGLPLPGPTPPTSARHGAPAVDRSTGVTLSDDERTQVMVIAVERGRLMQEADRMSAAIRSLAHLIARVHGLPADSAYDFESRDEGRTIVLVDVSP